MKKILITGENSYIGTSFESYMYLSCDDYEVDTVSTFDDKWKLVDFSKYDVVFHVAGIAHVSSSPAQKDLYYKINRDLTIEIANYSKIFGVKQFIFMSSIIIYGNQCDSINFSTIPNPKTFYGKSKLEADIAIQKLNSDTFHVVSIRPPMVYGKDSKGNFPKLAKLAEFTPIFPDIKNQRSMIYIDNLCECIKLIIDNQTSGYVYPQNSEYACTTEMVKLLALLRGKKIIFTKLFNPIIRYLLNVNLINKVFGNLIYDNSMSTYADNRYQIYTFEQSINSIVNNK